MIKARGPHLTTRDLSERWKCGEQTLINMRYRGEGPPWVKCGERLVRYRLTDIESYEEAQVQEGGAV